MHFFAAEYIMQGLQNETLSLLYCVLAEDDSVPTVSQIKAIYKNTTADSPLRRFLVAFSSDLWEFSEQDIAIPCELLLDVLMRLQEVGAAPNA